MIDDTTDDFARAFREVYAHEPRVIEREAEFREVCYVIVEVMREIRPVGDIDAVLDRFNAGAGVKIVLNTVPGTADDVQDATTFVN